MRRFITYLTPVFVGMTLSSLALSLAITNKMPPCGKNCNIHGADCQPCCDRDCDPVKNIDDHFACIRACDY